MARHEPSVADRSFPRVAASPVAEEPQRGGSAAGLHPGLHPGLHHLAANADAQTIHRAATSAGAVSSALLLQLQRQYGNAYVTRLIDRARDEGRQDDGLAHVEQSIEAARGGGSGLDATTLNRMNTAFGADFGHVRVHTDGESDGLNRAVAARAFTTGSDIFFRSGAYDPGSSEGRGLLAHELTHVVQQTGTGIRAKLTISDPGDAHEVEAERVARAFTEQEQVGDVASMAPSEVALSRSVNGMLMRRDDPPAGGAPQPATVPAAVPAVPQGAQPTAPAQPATTGADQVNLEWWINWENKLVGADVSSKSNQRTGKEAASGLLKMLPAAGAGSPALLPWVNASSSGAVKVGSMSQDANTKGMVSTDISWGKPPSAGAVVRVDESVAPADKSVKSQLPAKQAAASAAATAALNKALQLDGGIDLLKKDMLAAATQAVGDGYTVSVDVTLDPKRDFSSAVLPVAYDGAAKDDKRTALVVVPTDMQLLKGDGSVEVQKMLSQSDVAADAQHDVKAVTTEDVKKTALITDVSSSFESSFTNAFTDWHNKINKTNLSADANFTGTVGGDVAAGGTLKDLSIDFGTLLGLALIENPGLAFIIKKAVGTGKIGGEISGKLSAGLTAGAGGKASYSDEEVNQTLSKIDKSVKFNLKTFVHNEVTTSLTTKTVDAHDSAKASQTAHASGSVTKSRSSSETVAVKYIIHKPELHVTNG